ncbi:tyrosine-type recombinase/integrase [Solibacillus sp. A46]|uniref:Tyrosine-type recombinase/integrase n=2 Tax=Solibacillus TaxID=648800 RepID=A0ABR8Y2T4_9BACL|nr:MULTISPECIES: tyrosine-type recombinase/integrase [Solibacillus]MBD8033040.1 tyrosine-type recombinase/integrase [Solibacillus merdavium]MBD8038515.1 tyrosine-type recombinase/integrase [Solibacillus faecavium]
MQGSVKKRGNTDQYVVDIGRDPFTGKRKQKTKGGFKRKKDAQAALNKVLQEIDAQGYVEPSKEIFASFIESWFKSHFEKRIKETTASNAQSLINKHLIRENPFANKPLSKITTEDIDAFYNFKINEEYSSSYIHKMHQILNQAFNQAVKWKRIKYNPVNDADPPAVKKEEMKIWSYDEINTFLEHCKGERHYLTFLLAIYTGLRRGEILGLKWSDVDFINKTIHVQRSLAYIPKKGYILTSTKTRKSNRIIPISDMVVKALVNHRKQQEIWKEQLGEQYQEEDLVICTETGSKQDPRNVLRALKRLITTSGVTQIRFHDFRHTHASILISNSIDVVKVSKRLGHPNARITLETYAHLVPNEDNDLADVFEKALEKIS